MAEPSPASPGAQVLPAAARLASRPWAALDRWVPRLTVAVAVAVVALGQLAEDATDSPPLQLLSPSESVQRWTVVAAVFYMVLVAQFVDRIVDRAVMALPEMVEVTPETFRRYAARLGPLALSQELGLLIASAAIVFSMFVVLGSSLPIDDQATRKPVLLPQSGVEAGLILAGYTTVGWTVLSLVSGVLRRARALGQLSAERLSVDVFDTTALLPFGNIALATALAPAGLIVILLFGLGRPNEPLSWGVLLLVTSASVLALLLPLRGIHRQMAHAKHAALRGLNARIRELYVAAESDTAAAADMVETGRLNNRVTALVTLRKTVSEMTTWPFRDTLAFGRAVLIASAPLIYTIVSELIKVFWINPLRG